MNDTNPERRPAAEQTAADQTAALAAEPEHTKAQADEITNEEAKADETVCAVAQAAAGPEEAQTAAGPGPEEAQAPVLRCSAEPDEKMQRLLGRENRNSGILFSVLGAAAVAVGVVFLLFVKGTGGALLGGLIVALGALLFLCGAALLLLYLHGVRTAKGKGYCNRYAFEAQSFTVQTLQNGTVLGKTTIAYASLHKAYEKRGLLCLLPSPSVVYAVYLSSFSEEERNLLRERLGLPQK